MLYNRVLLVVQYNISESLFCDHFLFYEQSTDRKKFKENPIARLLKNKGKKIECALFTSFLSPVSVDFRFRFVVVSTANCKLPSMG